MNNLQEKIAVMQAYQEGRTIEIKYKGEWILVEEPTWNWHVCQYRVKASFTDAMQERAESEVKNPKDTFPYSNYESAFYAGAQYARE